MNGPTERERRWPQSGDCVRVSFNANLVSIDSTGCCGTFERGGEEFHFGACTIREASEADRESATLRARVAVLEQQIAAIEALCYHDGYTTWDVDKHLPGQGWKEAAHGHDPRLKCYPEFGCQLLIDPEDILEVLAAGVDPKGSMVVDNPTEGSPS